MTKQEFLKTIPEIKKMTIVFSQITKMPMVFCHEETMDDYIYAYLDEQDALEQVKRLNAEKKPAAAVSCKDKEVLRFLAELRVTGVNAVCFVQAGADGGEAHFLQLTDFLKFPDMESIPPEKRPVENPTLFISMLYFLQELRRPVEREEKQNIQELEEETSANLSRARLLLPFQEMKEGEGAVKRGVMFLKNEKGEVLFPLFTDGVELRKFMKDKPCGVTVVNMEMVADLFQKGDATGIVVNPAGAQLSLNKKGIEMLGQRFQA